MTRREQIPPPAIYLVGFLVGVALQVAFPVGGLPAALALPAAGLGVVAWLVLDGAAMLRFRRARTSPAPTKPTTKLVTSGPYRVTRNPMYLGMAALYVGMALGVGTIWSLALLPVVLAGIHYDVIPREERHLQARFGAEYRSYCKRVRRWL